MKENALKVHVAENRISEKAISLGYSFVRWLDKYEHCYSKAVLNCDIHGEYVMQYGVCVYQSSICQRCAKDSAGRKMQIKQESAERIVRSFIRDPWIRFIGFPDGYRNMRSRVSMSCDKHGEWEASFSSCKAGASCKMCSSARGVVSRTTTREDAESAISSMLSGGSCHFVKWASEYRNTRSKAEFICMDHGVFVKSLLKIQQGQSCPGCTRHGFNPTAPGSLYLLESDCGGYQKIGISGSIKRRMRELESKTPFSIKMKAVYKFDIGLRAREIESAVLANFMSAGLCGFDGCTEWLRSDPDISSYIKQRAL